VSRRVGEPTRAELEALAATLAPGEQRAVGGGIYLRIDGNGRMRFQFRLRSAGAHSRNAGGTYDSWEEAERARRAALARKEAGTPEGKERRRRLLLSEYASQQWWRHHVALNCDAVTQLNYKPPLKLIYEYFRGFRLEEINEEAVDEFAVWLKAKKTDKKTKRFYGSAYLRTLDILVRILNHAVENRVLEHNPAALTRKRAHKRRRGQPKVKPVPRRDVKHPRIVERVRLGVRGVGLEPFMFRAAIDLIAWEGLRPSEALALRHEHWRDEGGPLSHIDVEAAIKNISGRLFEDGTKTDTLHEPILWPAIAEELEELYELQGRPPLSSYVLTNRKGGPASWVNWRERLWYPALHRAGLAAAPQAMTEGVRTVGAFIPYTLRHTCATVMLHASKPGGGHYTPHEVARQLGHKASMTLDVYGHVMDDQTDVAGHTVDEIIRLARREGWGPQPGDPDYEAVTYTLAEAARETGLSHNQLLGRVHRGGLTVEKRDGIYVVNRDELVARGLVAPRRPRGGVVIPFRRSRAGRS
jgi:integrase